MLIQKSITFSNELNNSQGSSIIWGKPIFTVTSEEQTFHEKVIDTTLSSSHWSWQLCSFAKIKIFSSLARRPDHLTYWGAADLLPLRTIRAALPELLGKSNAGRYRVSLEGADILNLLCWPSLQVTPTAQPWSRPLENERLDQKLTSMMITHTQSHMAFIITLWCQG